MKIKDNRANKIRFQNLKAGDVFEYSGETYIKTSTDGVGTYNDYTKIVNIFNGNIDILRHSVYVTLLDAEVIIK